MGVPAAVLGDLITGTCPVHQVPNPSGAPTPTPLPFSAPLTRNVATSVLIASKPAAVAGSSGLNTPPHIGLHPSDPFLVPTTQAGTVVDGSTSVMIEGKPAARAGSGCTLCAGTPGTLSGTAGTVLVGG